LEYLTCLSDTRPLRSHIRPRGGHPSWRCLAVLIWSSGSERCERLYGRPYLTDVLAPSVGQWFDVMTWVRNTASLRLDMSTNLSGLLTLDELVQIQGSGPFVKVTLLRHKSEPSRNCEGSLVLACSGPTAPRGAVLRRGLRSPTT
jgi:hypothetical protein